MSDGLPVFPCQACTKVEEGRAEPKDLYDIITSRSREVMEEWVIEMMGMIGKLQTWDHRLTSKHSSNEGLRFKESPHTAKPVSMGQPKWGRAESISRGSAFLDLPNLGSLSSLSRPR